MDRVAVGSSLVLAALCFSGSAHALGPIDVEAGAKGGVATNPGTAGSTPYGFGLGGRAGVSLFDIYVGVSGLHYFGSSTALPVASSGPATMSISTTLLGVEAGYTFTQLPLIQVRPQIGIGNAHFSINIDRLGSASADHLYLEPGVTVLVPLGLLYVGADANALIVPSVGKGDASKTYAIAEPSKTYTSLSLHAQFGVRF